MGILNKLLDIPINAGYTCPMKCKYFRFMLEVFSRKLFFFGACACYVLMPRACSSGEAPSSAREEPTTAVPEYSFINSDRYVQNRTTGIEVSRGNRRRRDRGGNEAVFVELCSADSYDLHAVWFLRPPRATSRTSARFRRYARGKNLAARSLSLRPAPMTPIQ